MSPSQKKPRRPAKGTGKSAPRREPPPPFRESSPESESTEKLAKIAGLPAVAALFRRDPQRIMRLYYEERMKSAVGPICAELARLHRPYRMLSGDELTKVAGTVLHGGVVAAAIPRPLPDLQLAEAERWAQRREPILILDGVGNPHNLGAIARTLAFFGLQHLVISDHPEQAAPSDAAYRVAEGGLDAIDVHRLRHLPRSLKRLQQHFRVVGTALTDTGQPLEDLDADERPLALVLGNEEHGLGPQTLAVCETTVTLMGSGQVQSLNVSATAAILAYELSRRRHPPQPGKKRAR